MNLSDMLTFVRAQADTDTADAPDSTLTVYARAAYQDIISRVFPWPDKKGTFTFPSVVDQASYPLSGFSPATLEYVIGVSVDDDVLMWVSNEQFDELSLNATGSTTYATVYTVDGSTVKLWPTPSSVATYTVTGYRGFVLWPSGSDEPDMARGFDEPICWYMLSRFYQAQEDMELSARYMQDFEVGVERQIGRALRGSASSAGPRIFGGDPGLFGSRSYSDWVKLSVEG